MTAVTNDVALEASSDAHLIAQARLGEQSAFTLLYERHQGAALLVAAQYAPRHADVDDLVSEAFAQVFRLLQQGKGPDEFFRAYLFTCVRHLAARGRESQNKVQSTDDMTVLDTTLDHPDQNLEFIERQLIKDAYQSLPERWRTVLWYIEVEGLKPAEIATALGLSANGVAALAYRAREGLRQAYLQCHVSGHLPRACVETGEKLGAFTRGALAERDQVKVQEHLADCEECNAVVAELGEVNQSLRGVIGPLVLGGLAGPILDSLSMAPPVAGATAASAGAGASAGVQMAGEATATSAAKAGGLKGLFRFSANPVMASVATFGAVVLLISLGVGSVPLWRAAPWTNHAPTPVAVDAGPPEVNTGPDAMATIFVSDGNLAVAATGSNLAVPQGGGAAQGEANLVLPSGVTVRRAELTWASNSPAEDWWNITLVGPAGSKHKVAAQRRAVLEQGVQFGADVTEAVASGGAGLWRFADFDLADPEGQAWAGWALTVVFVDPSLAWSRVSILEGNLPVEPADYVSQPVNAPLAKVTSTHTVVWGARDPGAVTAWLLDGAANGELGQGYQVDSLIPGAPGGIELLRGDQAFFPEGQRDEVTPSISFRAPQTTDAPPSVGLIALVAPLEP